MLRKTAVSTRGPAAAVIRAGPPGTSGGPLLLHAV